MQTSYIRSKNDYCPTCQALLRLVATAQEVRAECERCGYAKRIRVRITN